jgi:hypothetical protein
MQTRDSEKQSEPGKEEEGKLPLFGTNDLFDLSEIAFRLELALAKAQLMTKSNDTIYEVNFETGKVRQLGYFGYLYDPFVDDPLEEMLKEVKR